MKSAPFRFDDKTHRYTTPEGAELLHITGLLTAAGYIDDAWYTEASCERGRIVHELTAEYDMGAIELQTCQSPHRGYLLAYAKAMTMIPHEWKYIEVPIAHPSGGWAGTPDRAGKIFHSNGVLDIKSGDEAKSHPIQTALQAVLLEEEMNLKAERQYRAALYVRANGRFYLREYTRNTEQVVEARRILARYVGLR